MKWIFTCFALLNSLFLSLPVLAQAQARALPAADFSSMRQTGTATVTQIVTPLTIRLDDGRFIHLAGLDFPDFDFYEPADLSVSAVEILNDFLKDKRVIIYQTHAKKAGRMNRMGHHIAHLARADNDVWVQGLLLSLGLARVRTTRYNPDMAAQMLAREKRARDETLGLWAIQAYHILSPETAASHIGSYQIIEGTVQSAAMRKNKLYLNFGHNWRDDFTVAISTFNLRAFTKQRIEPQKWNGKKIRVRGWIESYNGPYMEIDHPQRFEALFEDDIK